MDKLLTTSKLVKRSAEAQHITNKYGTFEVIVYEASGKEHVALVKGEVKKGVNVPVRMQSACLLGTALDSASCECQEQIKASLYFVSRQSHGVILYMDEEGRGLGLTIKVKALANKNRGLDTFEAVRALGKLPDIRNYQDEIFILKDLGVTSVQLITNNPDKIKALQDAGISVFDRIPIEIPATKQTKLHLKAKKDAGHLLKQPF